LPLVTGQGRNSHEFRSAEAERSVDAYGDAYG